MSGFGNFGGSGDSGPKPKKLGTQGSRGGPVWTPPSGSGEAATSGATPGTYDVNIFDPQGTWTNAAQESEDFLSGLKNTLFGTSQADYTGRHGGLLGDIPGVGAVTRAASEVVGNVGSAVAGVGGAALDTVGGALEHIDLRTDEEKNALAELYKLVPQSQVKAETDAAIAADPGAAGAYQARAVKEYRNSLESTELDPDLHANLFMTPGSAADTVTNLFGLMGLGQRYVERAVSGWDKADGLNRLDAIMQVGRGQAAFQGGFGDDSGGSLSATESVVFAMVEAGDWDENEALDFLASHNAGLSHNPLAQIAGTVATDPANILSLGTGFLAKGVATGAALALQERKGEAAIRAITGALKVATESGATDDIAKLTAKLADETKSLESIKGGLREAGTSGRFNVLGKAAESEKGTDIIRALYKVYEPMEAMQMDRAFKVARTIIDPLSSMDLKVPGRKAVVDVMTKSGTRMVIGAYGEGNNLRVLEALSNVTPGNSSPLADMFAEDMGTYAANTIRTVAATNQRDIALANGFGPQLAKTQVGVGLTEYLRKAPRSFGEYILREANRHRIHDFDDVAKANLARRLHNAYQTVEPEEWGRIIQDMNADQLGLLHAATYGRATKRLLAAVEAAQLSGAGRMTTKLNRVILINRTTLTREGAHGVVADIRKAKSLAERREVIEAAQTKYPELRSMSLDLTDLGKSSDGFAEELERTAEAFPHQFVDDELTELPDDLRALHDDETFTLGFAPEDEFKWGMARSNKAGGGFAATRPVWVDHVAGGLAMGYRPVGQRVAMNIAGQPILGGVAQKLAKPIDAIDAGISTMTKSISGTVIADSARAHFLQKAVAKYASVGVTSKVANDMMDALEDAVDRHSLVVRASGLATADMWRAVEDILPKSIRPTDFDKRDLLNLVLEAYDGDLRFVGLTQKLSSRVKRAFAFESNNASVLAEQMYPNLKFRLNLIFQAQEKVEPYILNAARGVTPARGRTLSTADKATARLLDRMQERSLITNADHEMAEYAGMYAVGEDVVSAAKSGKGAIGNVTSKLGVNWSAIREVKGVKRVNMLRSFRAGLGKDLREVWEVHQPGVWDDMLAEAQRKAGKLLDEDEFAVSVMAEHMLGNDVVVDMVRGRMQGLADQFDKVNYKAAIATGEWSRPQNLGELRTLDLDTMAELLAFPVGRAGKATASAADLRSAIAAGDLTIEDVTLALRRLNADPDYIKRVESALSFSWTGFWGTLKRDFNLSRVEQSRLEDMVANAASLRNMTPVDYISQVFSPSILRGEEGAVGELGKLVEVMRHGEASGDFAPSLARINTVGDGAETADDLIRQLSTVFAAHLDPSAKLALLKAFQPELAARIDSGELMVPDLAAIDEAWEAGGHEGLLNSITDAMNATDGDLFEASLPRTMAEYDAEFPAQEIVTDLIHDSDGSVVTVVLEGVGKGFREELPEARRLAMTRELARLRRTLPEVPFFHIDAMDLGDLHPELKGAAAVALGTRQDEGSIFINKMVNRTDEEKADLSDYARGASEFKDDEIGEMVPRVSNPGADFLAGRTDEDLLRHEFGHVLDLFLREGTVMTVGTAAQKKAAAKRVKAYTDFVRRYNNSPAARMLSEYATRNVDEAMGELFAVALNPNADLAEFARRAPMPPEAELGIIPHGWGKRGDELDAYIRQVENEYPELEEWLDELDIAMKAGDDDAINTTLSVMDDEIRKIEGVGPDDVDLFKMTGPQTVEEAVLEVRQILTDMGVYKPAAPASRNPDIIRAQQMFAKWTNAVIGGNLKNPTAPMADVLGRIKGFPTDNAVPYNFSEHMLLDAATTAMREKWDDAHRLQYYARQRSMLERSVNHPMFGLYPASYMWGKMLPEVIRFVTKEPFGVRTGAMAYTLMDINKSVAMQREFDPEFDKKLEELGHSAAFFAASYMMPATPWDMNANWPSWARTFGQQGLDMQARAEAGGTIDTGSDIAGTGLNPGMAIGKAADMMNPFKPIERTILEPAEELTEADEEAASTTVYAGPETVAAGELDDEGGILEDVMQQLQDLLK